MPRLILSPDGLSVALELADGERASLDEVLGLLAAERVQTEGCEETIAALIDCAGPARVPLLAGTPAVDGQDGRIHYTFRTSREGLRPVIGPDGRADYRNLGLVVAIEPGQVLARREPPTPGLPGRTVKGERLEPRPGREARLRAGTGTAVTPDGVAIVATMAGHPHLVGEVVTMRREYVLTADVALATGNLDFDGDLIILGNVEVGMRVRASGHVRVGGYVEGAEVTAGGNLTIDGGVRHQAHVRAEGNLLARFAENSRLESGVDLVVQEDMIHCRAEAGNALVVGGQLLGGEARAGERVEARTLGARMGVATHVAAMPDGPEANPELQRLESERSAVQARLAVISPRVREAQAQLARQPQPGIDLGVFKQVLEASAQLAAYDQELAERMEAARVRVPAASPRIDVLGAMLPGVTLQVGRACLKAHSAYPSGRFIAQAGAVVRVSG